MSSVWSRAFRGWLAACGAATAVISGFGIVVLNGAALLLFVLIDFIFVCLLTAIPSAVVIWLTEKYRIRSVVFFGCAGAVIGGVSIALFDRALAACARGQGGPIDQPAAVWTSGFAALFIVAGLVAGVTYWFVTGKDRISEPSI